MSLLYISQVRLCKFQFPWSYKYILLRLLLVVYEFHHDFTLIKLQLINHISSTNEDKFLFTMSLPCIKTYSSIKKMLLTKVSDNRLAKRYGLFEFLIHKLCVKVDLTLFFEIYEFINLLKLICPRLFGPILSVFICTDNCQACFF